MPARLRRRAEAPIPRYDPFTTIDAAASEFALTPRDIIGLINAGRVFGLPDRHARFGLMVLRDDLRRLRDAAAATSA